VVGRFASSIVHDLKNPLCIINIAADLIARPGVTPESRATAQRSIAQQVEGITNMVNDILEFTRGGRSTELFGLVDYGEFVRALVLDSRPELALKSINLELAVPPPAIRLPINPKRLKRVFYNLFVNAADAMPAGGKLLLRFRTSEQDITTEIEDSGPGIAPAIADRLFEAFATYGKSKGTGLGLAIAQRIIEDHQGKISARNQPSGGAIFVFTLPRERRTVEP
jgi:signal transduction histidine kinase